MIGLEYSGHVIGSPSEWQPPPNVASTPVGSIASTPVGGIASTPMPWAGDVTHQHSSTYAYSSASGSWGQAASNGHAPLASTMPASLDTAHASSSASGATVAGGMSLVVTGCADQKMGDTVRGTFQQVSSNHGKPVFKRIDAPAGIRTAVLIYYWDDRDGPDMCGWWFGPEVGGDQVWAFNGTRAPTPPGTGWKIPFDGPVDTTMRLRVQSSSSSKAEAVEDPATKWPTPQSPLSGNASLPPPPGRPVPEVDRRDWNGRAWDSAPAAPAQGSAVPPQRSATDPSREDVDFEMLEARLRREEAEDTALKVMRRAIQNMSSVTPETLEQLSGELNKAQAEQWDHLGQHQKQVAEEVASARFQAQERLLRIQSERAEAERIKREEEERLGGLVREASEQAAHAEAQVNEVLSTVTDLTELELLVSADEAHQMAQSLFKAYGASKALLEASLAALDGTNVGLEAELAHLPPDSPSAALYAEARTKLGKMQTQSRALRNSLDGLSDFVTEVRERTTRRVAAERRRSNMRELFSRYDADGDGRLNNAELAALARHEYSLDLSEAFLSKARRYLCRGGGVPFDSFRRLRQMLGVEFSEVRLREAINAEEERKRREQEEVDRQRRDIADRKQRAQSLLDEASEFLSEAMEDMPKATKAAKPLLAEERLGSDALQGVLAATDAVLAPLGVAIPGARSKLKEAIQVLGEDLRENFVPQMIRIEERLRSMEERDEVIREAVAEGRERAKRRAAEEEKSAKNRKALSKFEKRFQDPDESSDGDFDF